MKQHPRGVYYITSLINKYKYILMLIDIQVLVQEQHRDEQELEELGLEIEEEHSTRKEEFKTVTVNHESIELIQPFSDNNALVFLESGTTIMTKRNRRQLAKYINGKIS